MPLQLDAYKNISSGISQLALISDGQGTRIGKASDTNVGFLKRLFNTDASKKINIEITKDFKAALARAYRAEVADEAFMAVIGKDGLKGAKLSASLVSRTISMADEIVKKRLAPPPGQTMMLTMRLDGEETSFNLAGMADGAQRTMTDAKKTLTSLHDLLMEMPTDKLALQDFTTNINEAKTKAQTLINDLRSIPDTGKVISALQKAVDMVDGKISEATEVCNNNPITYKALTEFTGKYIDAAMSAISKIPNDGDTYGLNGATKGQLIQTLKKFAKDDGFLKTLADYTTNPASRLFSSASLEQQAEIRKVLPQVPSGASLDDTCPDPKAFVGKDFVEKLAKYCTAMVMQDLKAHVPEKSISFESSTFTEDMKKAIQREMEDILDHGEWKPIEKNVTFSLDGVSLKGKSAITPASQMGGAMTQIYNDKGPNGPKGYNCMSFGEPTHAVNLAHSKFEIDVDGQTQVAFSGIRHGVHAAVDIESPAEFKAANLSRAKETLIAAFTSNPQLVSKALADPSKPCSFVFNSVSLLTPDFARDLFGSKRENEKLMLKAQTDAYQSLNGQEIKIDVPVTTTDSNGQSVTTTTQVTIKPVISTFNYGVNWGGVGGLSSIFGGWGVSKDMNANGLRNLVQFARTTLADLQTEIDQSTDPAEKTRLQNKSNAITTLLRQINSIDQRKTYSSDGHEAYKMASRIAVLTNLLGGVPAWNCKSGKDRTGMMDVECKFIATLAALGKKIPEPGAQLTSEQKLLYRNLLLQSGNHEMQKYNTGLAGYKLENVSSITERIGDIASHTAFLGGSKLVHS